MLLDDSCFELVCIGLVAGTCELAADMMLHSWHDWVAHAGLLADVKFDMEPQNN